MNKPMRGIARIAMAVAAVTVPATAAGEPAHADVSACSATPGAGQYSATATATCPAGAGTFTFRVAANCYDTYPTGNLQFEGVVYGPWVRASTSSVTSSSVHCNGYVPGSGVASGATVQTS